MRVVHGIERAARVTARVLRNGKRVRNLPKQTLEQADSIDVNWNRRDRLSKAVGSRRTSCEQRVALRTATLSTYALLLTARDLGVVVKIEAHVDSSRRAARLAVQDEEENHALGIFAGEFSNTTPL